MYFILETIMMFRSLTKCPQCAKLSNYGKNRWFFVIKNKRKYMAKRCKFWTVLTYVLYQIITFQNSTPKVSYVRNIKWSTYEYDILPVGYSFLNFMYLMWIEGSSRSVCLSKTPRACFGQAILDFRVETEDLICTKPINLM